MNTNDISRIHKGILAELSDSLGKIRDDDVVKMCDSITISKRVFVSGSGRSGLVMKCFAMRLMHLGLIVGVVGEVTAPSIGKEDLLIIGTGSGETMNAKYIAQSAKSFGAKIGVITAFPDSSVGNLADIIIQVSAPSIKAGKTSQIMSHQPMGNLFEQSLLLLSDCIIMKLMLDLNIDEKMMFSRHANLE